MTNILKLADREIQIVTAALAIVSPSGGGSETYSLLMKIYNATPQINSDPELEMQFCRTVISEAREAGALK